MTRVAVIGLDCLVPQLVFERFRSELPTLSALADGGVSGTLRSVDPPITVPAWSCMMSGYTAGALGIYGFRNRKDNTYDGLAFATSRAVKVPRVWDYLSDAGLRSIVLGVPGTYPPTPIDGVMVGDFLTPNADSNFTHPPELRDELRDVAGPYLIDVANFRTTEKDRVLRQVWEMTRQRFAYARHLLATRPWDFFMMVEMGADRLQHGFWKYCDPDHPKYEPGNPYESAFRDYYVFLDGEVASLLEQLPDDTHVLVVSDHGGQPMQGGFCFNEWLISEGYLTLATQPTGKTPIAAADIDWTRTVAWGDGGYYGRLFMNVAGREPQGIVPPERYEEVRQELIDKLAAVPDHTGAPLETKAHRPQELYDRVEGVAPDLIVYFGDLRWRSVGSVGMGSWYTFENDTGPDDANHAFDGVIIARSPEFAAGRSLEGAKLLDIGPTVLDMFDLQPVAGVEGRSMLTRLTR